MKICLEKSSAKKPVKHIYCLVKWQFEYQILYENRMPLRSTKTGVVLGYE
jgi:hypothetical protein